MPQDPFQATDLQAATLDAFTLQVQTLLGAKRRTQRWHAGTDAAVIFLIAGNPSLDPSNFKPPKGKCTMKALVSLIFKVCGSPETGHLRIYRRPFSERVQQEPLQKATRSSPRHSRRTLRSTNFLLADHNTDFRDKVNVRWPRSLTTRSLTDCKAVRSQSHHHSFAGC